MNNGMTIEKLSQMKLYGMAEALRAAMETGADRNSGVQEFIAHLVESEWEDKHQRRTQRLTRAAQFRSQALLSELDWTVNRGLDKTLLLKLSDCRFVHEKKTIIITGPTGVGKSFLAQALGSQCCDLAFRTRYCNCNKLFPLLKEKRMDGSYARFMSELAKTNLLVLDDFGLMHLDGHDRLSLLEIVEDRYAKSATIITSQIPVAQWYEIIGDPTISDAVCDRIIHGAIRIEMQGPSMRSEISRREESACLNSATAV